VHSEYSLLDGACRVDRLCRRTAEDGAPAVALTDHGVMYGAMEFYYAARDTSLTPIIGCEAYIAPRGRFDRTVREEAHVTLLAADLIGYRNLTALISKGFLEGYYYKPRIDLDLLAEHNDGLIVLSGCMSGMVAAPLLKNDYETAVKNAKTYVDIFGDRFYIEVMRHGMPEEEAINTGLVKVARQLNVPIVATNDSHYLEQRDAPAHDVLLCIGTGKTVSDTSRMKFYSDQFYVKSADEMYELWSDLPEACENTVKIANRVDIKIPEKIFHLPQYPVPEEPAEPDRTAESYLREICEAGLVDRYGAERAANDEALRGRLDYELDVINKMGYASYFLIVWDFIKYARDHSIPVGPGRGSAVGSVVSYCLKITDLDPLKFNLIFERFLNPDRISMPDIDTDFCVERRDEVIAYVTEKYGKERVAQIVTFGTMAARAAVRDAGRALGVPLPDVDKVAKMIPSGPGGLSIEKALEQIPELKMAAAGSPQIRKLLDTAKDIEGLARNAGTHAAGVVISAGPLIEYTPLVKFNDGGVNTQFDMIWVEKIGLLKMDFLGLRNLTVMNAAAEEIRRTVDGNFDLAKIRDDDKKTYDMLSRGETMGVFQVESEGMTRVCVELKPTTFEDIIALVALYRPGPMEWIPQFINSKHGRTKPKYLHPKLEPILTGTYGVACLKHNTPIWTADGSEKPISAVNPGDVLLTHNDGRIRPANVEKVWPSGKKRILRITLSTGTVIECSEDHRFPTPEGDLMAKDLKVNGQNGNRQYAYRTSSSILFEAWQRSENEPRREVGIDRAYFLGLLVGDGSLDASSIYLTASSKLAAEWIAGLGTYSFGARATVYFNTRAWYTRLAFDTTPKPTPLTLWLDSLYGDRSWKKTCAGKHLPREFVHWSEKERLALLRGLWDSDGCYLAGSPYFRSTSPALLRQVGALLSSLKIAYYLRANAVHVQDVGRFLKLLDGSWMPEKRGADRRRNSVMPISARELRKRAESPLRAIDLESRKIFDRATKTVMAKPNLYAGYGERNPGLRRAYESVYEDTYLQDSRPVYIDKIEYVGEDECFDIQMSDQSSPYFIANGIATHNCYQEQAMQIARDIAGFTMAQADELRKVIGKKQKELIPVYRKKFIDGAMATSGITEQLAEQIFAFIEPFAGYGFNKSHAAAYAWITYQTAFLKANHPLQYLTALMTSVRNNTDKLVEYIDEAKHTGITVLPPDINESLTDFAVVGERIRFGLAAIKGVGEGAVQSIIAARDRDGRFVDLFDLAKRVDSKQVNRRVFEALNKCGALDELPGNRAQKLAALDVALDLAAHATREKELGQVSLFGDAAEHAPALTPTLPNVPAPSTREMLAWEKETLGIFVSGHPLADVQELLVRNGSTPIKDLRNLDDDALVQIAGMVVSVRRTLTKAGTQMLIAQLEDTTGVCDVIVFSKMYAQVQGLFTEDAVLVVKGRVRWRERPGAAPGEEGPVDLSVSANEVAPFEIPRNFTARPVREWHVQVDSREQIDRLAALVDKWPGQVPVTMHARGKSQRLARTMTADHRVRSELERIFGRGNVRHDA
jgi:DNA polymerase III subunit alpha